MEDGRKRWRVIITAKTNPGVDRTGGQDLGPDAGECNIIRKGAIRAFYESSLVTEMAPVIRLKPSRIA
jgi:hypothetical protein